MTAKRSLLACIVLVVACTALGAGRVGAATCAKSKHFSINTGQIRSTLLPYHPGITEDDVEYWVLHALQQVVVQSGANLDLIYDGRTTVSPFCLGGPGAPDGINQIGSLPMPQGVVAWQNGEDICLDADGDPFRSGYALSEYLPADQGLIDPIGTLMHEVEHWVGLSTSTAACLSGLVCDAQGHVEDTTLDGGTVQGTIMQRTLTGTDIRRLRYLVNTSVSGCTVEAGPKLAFAKRSTGSSSIYDPSGVSLPYRTVAGPGAAMGVGSAGGTFVVAATPGAGTDFQYTPNGVRFVRASLASGLDSASDFTSTSYTFDSNYLTYAAPAVAGKSSGSALWVAAWPLRKDFNYTCPGIRVVTSTNEFTSLSNQLTLSDCTAQQVALEWNPQRQKFILMYVYQSSLYQNYIQDPGDPLNGAIIVRTSSDGVSWSSGQLLGKSLSTPGLGCSSIGANTCTMAVTNHADFSGYQHPIGVNWGFNLNASAQVVGTTFTSDFYWEASKFDADVSRGTVVGDNTFWLTHFGPFPWWPSGLKTSYQAASAHINAPATSFAYSFVPASSPEVSRFPAEIAAKHDEYSAYLFYAK